MTLFWWGYVFSTFSVYNWQAYDTQLMLGLCLLPPNPSYLNYTTSVACVCAWMLRIRSTWTVCCHLDEITKPTLDGCILPSLDTHQQLERAPGGHVPLRRPGAQRTCLECHQDSPKVACDALPSLPQPPTALRTPQTPPPPPTHPPTSAPTVPLTCRPQGVHRLVHSMPRPRDSRWALERHYVSNSPINFLTLNISSKS